MGAHTRVQWFWLSFTLWGITTHPWHPKGVYWQKKFNFIHGLLCVNVIYFILNAYPLQYWYFTLLLSTNWLFEYCKGVLCQLMQVWSVFLIIYMQLAHYVLYVTYITKVQWTKIHKWKFSGKEKSGGNVPHLDISIVWKALPSIQILYFPSKCQHT
jgi:hypothetical protein